MLAPLAALRERRGVTRARGAVRRAGGGGRAGDQARRLLARVVADGRAWSTRPRWPPPARSCCSTAPRASARCPVDVGALGCDFYAASGQKWLCGPNGIGYLYVRADAVGGAASALAELRRRSRPPARARARPPPRRARASTSASPRRTTSAWALAALDVLEARRARGACTRAAASWPPALAAAARRRGVGRPRGRSTLVVLGGRRPRGRGRAAARRGLRGPRTCPARRTCGRRWARGRARRSSSGWPSVTCASSDDDAEDDAADHHGEATAPTTP